MTPKKMMILETPTEFYARPWDGKSQLPGNCVSTAEYVGKNGRRPLYRDEDDTLLFIESDGEGGYSVQIYRNNPYDVP